MLISVNLGTIQDGSFYEDVQYMSEFKTSNKPRTLVAAQLSGDDAEEDTAIHFYASGYYLGTVWNLETDGTFEGDQMQSIYGFIPPNSDLQMKCESTATDAVYAFINIKES